MDKKLTPAEREIIENEGFFAYLEGKTSKENPYSTEDQSRKHAAWHSGWDNADWAQSEADEEYYEENYPEIARP